MKHAVEWLLYAAIFWIALIYYFAESPPTNFLYANF